MGLKKWNGTQWVSASPSIQVTTDIVTNSSQVSGQTLTSALNDLNNRVPSNGTNGYYLKKTAQGNTWAEVQGGEDNIYIAEVEMDIFTEPYTITGPTFATVKAAYDNNKIIYAKATAEIQSIQACTFLGLDAFAYNTFLFSYSFGANNRAPKITLLSLSTDNSWNYAVTDLESQSNKVTSWSSSISDDNYPSEKLVKNSLNEKISMPFGGATGNVLTKTDDGVMWAAGGSGTSGVTGILMNNQSVPVSSGIANLGTVITSHQDISSKITMPSGGSNGNVLTKTNDGVAWTSIGGGGTITGITMNGQSMGTSGVVNLGTVITSHQDISSKENTSNKVNSLSSASSTAQYPNAACVYSALSSKISMPSGGSTGNVLTKTDDGVTWAAGGSGSGTITEIRMNGQSKGTSGVVDLGTVITAHQDISGKLDIPACITSGTSITLADNTEYRLSNVTTLNVSYPADYFNSWMEISTAQSTAATISISFPSNTKYIGSIPTFGHGETWHISVKDEVMVAGLVESGD